MTVFEIHSPRKRPSSSAAASPHHCLAGHVVLLIGNLGAGKTTLAKGIVSGLGAVEPEEVSSPTFTLIHEYGPRVYHIDLYRLDRAEQVATLGLDEIFDRDAVVLIEWGERFPELLPAERIEIRLTTLGWRSARNQSDRVEMTRSPHGNTCAKSHLRRMAPDADCSGWHG